MFTIVCFGDSTTDDTFMPNPDHALSYSNLKVYTDWLSEKLPDILGRDLVVHNKGVSGDTTADAKVRFNQDVLSCNPNLVIIQFGANDQLVRQDYQLSAHMVSLDAYCYNLLFFINRCRGMGAEVVLMSPGLMLWTEDFKSRFFEPPFDLQSRYGINFYLDKYAQKVRDIATKENVPLIDIHQMEQEYDLRVNQNLQDLLPDGLHPNNIGHEIIAQCMLETLEEWVK